MAQKSYFSGGTAAARRLLERHRQAMADPVMLSIVCRRCVRTCIDVQEVGVLEAVGRIDKTRISTYLHKPKRAS